MSPFSRASLPFRDRLSAARRRGFGIAEVAISSVLLVAAMVLAAQFATAVASGRLATGRRQRALQEAAHVMERLTSRPWDELTPALAGSIKLPPDANAFLHDGTVVVTIVVDPADPSAKKITVEVGRGAPSNAPAPVRLVAWTYRRARAKP